MKLQTVISKIKQRLSKHFFVLLWCTVSLCLISYGLKENVNLYVGVNQVKAKISQYNNKQFRLGGIVKVGSVTKSSNGIEFDVVDTDPKTDEIGIIRVAYNGLLPSLFQENKAMVADGRLSEEVFYATEILAKHDENYQIPSAQ